MIFYTHVEHSPTKTVYIKYYLKHTHTNALLTTHTHTHTHIHTHTHTHTHTHNDWSRNRVLILVRMEMLWEEEGFQFGFKRWQGWAVSKPLRSYGSEFQMWGPKQEKVQKPWILRDRLSAQTLFIIISIPSTALHSKSMPTQPQTVSESHVHPH